MEKYHNNCNGFRSCIKCGDPGPYCSECDKCQNKECGWDCPGNYICHMCEKDIKPEDKRSQCSCCKELYYHSSCLVECMCGVGTTHYLCSPYNHLCDGLDINDDDCACPNGICINGKMETLLPGVNIYICKVHRNIALERIKTLYKQHF